MKKRLLKLPKFFIILTIFSVIYSLVLGGSIIQAQNTTLTADQINAREAELRAELAKTEKEIAEWRAVLKQKQGESASIARDAAILNAKIKEAQLVIKARNLAIETLGKDINEKVKTIGTLEARIEKNKDSLSQLIRKTNEIDSYSIAEVALSNQNISDFFVDLDSFDFVKRALGEKLAEIRGVKKENEDAKSILSRKKDEEADAKAVIEAEKRRVEKSEAEKKALLAVSKSQEKTYGQIVAEREKKAAQIRSALFALRDTAAIPFGTALIYANEVHKKTGIRPAFLLAILTQESDLGKNQGSCLVNDLTTGNGAGKNTGTLFEQVMKAPRDTVPFESITTRLGREWKMTPVSCPLGVTYYVGRGFGGGMGPSQFIPSTWELMKTRIGGALGMGGDSVDPWNPEHAFMATGVYMKDLGAGAQTYSAERNAACKYYSGASCQAGRKPPNAPYGDSVMAKAQHIQENMIDPLQNF